MKLIQCVNRMRSGWWNSLLLGTIIYSLSGLQTGHGLYFSAFASAAVMMVVFAIFVGGHPSRWYVFVFFITSTSCGLRLPEHPRSSDIATPIASVRMEGNSFI